MLNVYEFDYKLERSDANTNWFEVYKDDDVLDTLLETKSLDTAIKFCYDSGQNFTVNTLQAYYNEFGEE